MVLVWPTESSRARQSPPQRAVWKRTRGKRAEIRVRIKKARKGAFIAVRSKSAVSGVYIFIVENAPNSHQDSLWRVESQNLGFLCGAVHIPKPYQPPYRIP